MKTLLRLFVALFPAALLFAEATPTRNLGAGEAKAHFGETATVCGKVVSGRYASDSRGQPTFLNFDKPYPNQVFTVVIWGTDRNKFDEPEKKYLDKQLCASGVIGAYRGSPQIVATEPGQLKLQR